MGNIGSHVNIYLGGGTDIKRKTNVTLAVVTALSRHIQLCPGAQPENTERDNHQKTQPPYPSRNRNHRGVEKHERHEAVNGHRDPTRGPSAICIRAPPDPDHVESPNGCDEVLV